VQELKDLILADMAVLVGPVRQELLSGIKEQGDFDRLKSLLRAYEDESITGEDYETAAEFFNICRRHGVRGSHTDFLLCAVSSNRDLYLFTTDKDFEHYAEHLPVNKYLLRGSYL
jgi:predicted nucleic acid-binding protein